MFNTVGFIGCGHMGSALARAVRAGAPEAELYFANRSPAKAEALVQALGGERADNGEIARQCSLIFLGVKPQMMEGVLSNIAPVLQGRKDRFVLVTMAAGLTMERIRAMAGGAWPVVRIMPNTPAAVGAGVVQLCADGVTEQEKEEVMALLAPAGLVDELPEGLMDAASAVSGCGPAFAYLFLEGLADGAVACGLPRDKAARYAAQMLQGAALLALESGEHPGQLKDAVCSPGGTTIQGVRALEARGFRAAAMEAVIAAYEKSRQL